MPGGPKMGNTYPVTLSSYPNWVAHTTPYTAEWGNSVGFEFYQLEYALGIMPQGTYHDVKARLDFMEGQIGYNYFTQIYINVNQLTVQGKILFDTVRFDNGGQEDIANNQIKIKQEGWYWIILDLFLELQPGAADECDMKVILYIGGIEKHYDNKFSVEQIFTGVHINTLVYCPVDTTIYAEADAGAGNPSGNIRHQGQMSRITVRQMRREY